MTRFHAADVIRPNVNNGYVWMVNGARAEVNRAITSADLEAQIKSIKEDLYIREAVLVEVSRAEAEAVGVEAERVYKIANPDRDDWMSLSDDEAAPFLRIAQSRLENRETYWWRVLASEEK